MERSSTRLGRNKRPSSTIRVSGTQSLLQKILSYYTKRLLVEYNGPFRVDSFASERRLSYVLHHLNGRLFRGTFHGNHLKRFIPRSGLLADATDPLLPTESGEDVDNTDISWDFCNIRPSLH